MTQTEIAASNWGKKLKELATELGFESCRISKATFLEDEAPRLEAWLKEGHHGQMKYMENHFDKRLDPRLLVEGTRSVVSLVFSYYPEKELFPEGALKISKYAYGEDYHKVLKDKLKELLFRFREVAGSVEGRVFVDSAPVLEKAWATRNGSGWLGKHTNIVHPRSGSFFFLCEMLLDIDLGEDQPIHDHCGTCTRCIDACPTDAIFAPYQLDGSRCISYLTIELKEAIPTAFQGKMEDWIFGCDICQDVCPWNLKFATPSSETRFQPHPELQVFSRKDWLELSNEVFEELFLKSAVNRTGFAGLVRNIAFAETKPSTNQESAS